MKVEHYAQGDPWVGYIICPACAHLTPAWRSSGMSDSCPHFYCDTCSNALLREADKDLLYAHPVDAALLDRIAATLPACPCGGRFAPGTNPKCRECRAPIPHQDDPVKRLTDPHVILVDGALLVRDRLYTYQVRIDRPSLLARLLSWFRR
jgi:hypothetical protein